MAAAAELYKAREYCFLLLKFRPRSEKELGQRLIRKNFSPEAIRETISFLKEKHFIDDLEFARAWTSSRLKKSYGFKRIQQELVLKGVDKQIIANCIDELKEDYSEESKIKELALKQFEKHQGIEPRKARNRAYGYLVRRGFSTDLILEVLNNL